MVLIGMFDKLLLLVWVTEPNPVPFDFASGADADADVDVGAVRYLGEVGSVMYVMQAT